MCAAHAKYLLGGGWKEAPGGRIEGGLGGCRGHGRAGRGLARRGLYVYLVVKPLCQEKRKMPSDFFGRPLRPRAKGTCSSVLCLETISGMGEATKYRQASGHLLHPLPLPWSSLNTHRRPLDPRDGRGRSTAPGLEAVAAPSARSAQIPNSSSLSPANPHHARSHRRSRTLLHPQRPRQPRQPPSRSAHAECLSDP